MIIDSINDITLTQQSYLQLTNEIEALKVKALNKLKKEDKNVKAFVESKLYIILKSNIVPKKDKYEIYLKSLNSYKDCIVEEVFNILLEMIDTGEISVCVLDSIGAMVSNQATEKEIGERTYGGISMALTEFSKKITPVLARTQTLYL